MTPQEKAKQLVERFYFALPNNGSETGVCNVHQRWEEGKQCAIIAVEFARQEFADHCTAEIATDGTPNDHFDTIKAEIEKL
jgi:hypothetical protein